MPTITQHNSIEISPEKFLNNCSSSELYELQLLLNSERYQAKIREVEGQVEEAKKDIRPGLPFKVSELEGDI